MSKRRPVVYSSLPNTISTISQVDDTSPKELLNTSNKMENIEKTITIEEKKEKRKAPVVRLFNEESPMVEYNQIIKKEEKKKVKKCLSRVANESVFEYFADGRHKFYIEYRCNYPCFENRDVCIKCLQKKLTCQIQFSRLFDHGLVYEPIPDQSHLFGGKWYQENCKKWGPPSSDIIEFALEHQREARGHFEVVQPIYEFPTSKAKQQSISQDMPRKKASNTIVESKEEEVPKVKRGRKPKVMTLQDLPPITESTLPESDPSKCIPIVNKLSKSNSPEKIQPPPKTPKKRAVRKKSEPTPYEALVQTQPLIYKDVSIPTHMEESLEEIDLDDYEKEYVKISLFTIGQTSYFRDPIKNKLYRKIKDKIPGEYIGRYDPQSESIMTDIPDSDDESEE
jgi:hypothetical protein